MTSTQDVTARGQQLPPPGSGQWQDHGQPVDAWLREDLRQAYDPVLGEDVPEHLLAILSPGRSRH